jgi:hypothetical protein
MLLSVAVLLAIAFADVIDPNSRDATFHAGVHEVHEDDEENERVRDIIEAHEEAMREQLLEFPDTDD